MTVETYDAMLERCYAGPGAADSLRLTLHAFDAAVEVSDRDHCTVTYLESDRRLRIYAGACNLVAPFESDLALTLPRDHAVATRATDVGGYLEDAPKRHPELQPVVIPRVAVPERYTELLRGLRAAAEELTAAGRGNRPHDDALEAALRRVV